MSHFRPVAILASLIICTPLVLAAGTTPDRGKRLLPKLFESAASDAADCTARIQVDGKDAALGTIVDKTGYILTKGSELRSSSIKVVFRDGTEYDAEYVGYHKASDLALLKISAEDLTQAKFVGAKIAEPGNWVAATGISSEPVAVGIISAAARKLFGPESMIENANKGYIGIMYDIRSKEEVIVTEVVKGAAAAKAGLKAGDVMLEVAGVKVKNREHLPEILDLYKPGDKIAVKVKRKAKDSEEFDELSFTMTLSSRVDMSKENNKDEMMNLSGGLLSGRRTGFPQVIQHDMILQAKDCGGPLVDLEGRVVGINIARAGRVETWALPAEVILPVLIDLKDGKFPAPKLPKTASKPVEK